MNLYENISLNITDSLEREKILSKVEDLVLTIEHFKEEIESIKKMTHEDFQEDSDGI